MRTEEVLSPDEVMEAAQRAASIQLRYARQGTSLALAAMGGARAMEPLRHYPAHDVSDRRAGTRFYYHTHDSKRQHKDEHGHFHLFVYPPVEADQPTDGPVFFHLAGLSLDARGQALRWFTTNRWVTGEHWYPAERVVQALQNFEVRTHGRMAPVARWLSAMVCLFAPRIEALLHQRDKVMASQMAGRDPEVVFEDRSLDLLSECPASLHERLRELST